jgi:hypothetical protein
MTYELEKISKETVVAQSRRYIGTFLEGLSEITQNILCVGRDSSRETPEYKTSTLPLRQPFR